MQFKIKVNSALTVICLLSSLFPFLEVQPAHAQPALNQFKRFRDWCLNQSILPERQQRNVQRLLKKVETQDCTLAEKKLVEMKELYINLSGADLRLIATVPNLVSLSLEIANYASGKSASTDLSPLTQLKQLKSLSLAGGFQDIRPLTRMHHLSELHLHRGTVSDISILKQLTNLTAVSVTNTKIEDLRALSSLKNLTYLDVSLNPLKGDLTPLSALTQLKSLTVNGNITDIRPLASLTRLEFLDLGNSQISDLRPLSKLVNLKRLRLFKNPIRDVSPLVSLQQLVELDLRGTQIQDRRPLSKLPKLKILRIDEGFTR